MPRFRCTATQCSTPAAVFVLLAKYNAATAAGIDANRRNAGVNFAHASDARVAHAGVSKYSNQLSIKRWFSSNGSVDRSVNKNVSSNVSCIPAQRATAHSTASNKNNNAAMNTCKHHTELMMSDGAGAAGGVVYLFVTPYNMCTVTGIVSKVPQGTARGFPS